MPIPPYVLEVPKGTDMASGVKKVPGLRRCARGSLPVTAVVILALVVVACIALFHPTISIEITFPPIFP